MIPANYRQLTRAQVLTRFVGQERPRCFVHALRLHEEQSVTVAAGEHTLYVQWANSGGRRRGSASAPQLAILTLNDLDWAEYAVGDIDENGDLVSESYLLRLYAPDGEGRTQAEHEAHQQAMIAAVQDAVNETFVAPPVVPSVPMRPLTPHDSYMLLTASGSTCPRCSQTVALLSRADGIVGAAAPAFFVCFSCQFVGQAGVGPVQDVRYEVA